MAVVGAAARAATPGAPVRSMPAGLCRAPALVAPGERADQPSPGTQRRKAAAARRGARRAIGSGEGVPQAPAAEGAAAAVAAAVAAAGAAAGGRRCGGQAVAVMQALCC